ARNNNADDVYAYLGGPDDLHSAAWKNLKPGETYQTVPVAIGCVRGGFGEAVEALTRYRREACVRKPSRNSRCPVIFNDYMNCLWGDPTEAKELPLIAAAAKAGCEYSSLMRAGTQISMKIGVKPSGHGNLPPRDGREA